MFFFSFSFKFIILYRVYSIIYIKFKRKFIFCYYKQLRVSNLRIKSIDKQVFTIVTMQIFVKIMWAHNAYYYNNIVVSM